MSHKLPVLRPVLDRVLVRLDGKRKETEGGLLIPDRSQERPKTGEVLAVGPGRLDTEGKRIPMCVKVGDRVLWKGYYDNRGIAVPEGLAPKGEDLVIVREDDLYAELED